MFTGLVEELAAVVRVDVRQHGANLQLRAKRVLEGVQLGDSIAVNGVCLTVVHFDASTFTLDAVPETLRKTNLGKLKAGQLVHVERAMHANGRFGGHIVSGHIDGVGVLQHKEQEGIASVLTIATPAGVLRYIVDKGSICVDGVSLTVMDVNDHSFRVSLIPHTGSVTTLNLAPLGTEFNLECDVLAKYVEKLMYLGPHGQTDDVNSMAPKSESLSLTFLAEHGFA